MMLVFVFALPLTAALLCLALNQTAPTRWLGFGSAVACLSVGVGLLLGRSRGELAAPEYIWASFNEETIRLALRFDATGWLFALLLSFSVALALFSLALAAPPRLRGYGGLFASLSLVFLATLVGLALQEFVLAPLAWALVALLGFVTLRASGVSSDAPMLPVGLLAGLTSAVILLGAALLLRGVAVDSPPSVAVLVCWVPAALMVFGAAPFHHVVEEFASAPADIAGFLIALGLPFLGGATLIQMMLSQAALTPEWRVVWLVIGLVTLVTCAVGAIGERRLRQVIGWQFSAQMGLLLIAVGQSEMAAIAAPALLLNTALTTLASYLAVALIERRAGTDDMSELVIDQPLVIPGMALLVAAAAAVGVPGTWGFWARGWLYDELLAAAPWSLPPLLAGTALMAVAYLAPVTTFFRGSTASDGDAESFRGWSARVGVVCPLIAAVPLLALGVAPQFGWQALASAGAQEAPGLTERLSSALPDVGAQVGSALVALLLLSAPFLLRRIQPRALPQDRDVYGNAALPQALGESLRLFAWLGAPTKLFQRAWDAVLWLSQVIRQALALFEQRYYLAGFMIGLVVVVLLLL
jgi:formate hydrogenlyase subunit 3/multisubunit Na+/H+ antiporter MnhD subunit